MQTVLRRTVYALILLCSACAASAQVATGSYPYGTYDTPGIDTINVGNLNAHLAIPVLNKTGRGLPFYYYLGYDSSVWYPATVSGATTWQPASNFGWTADTNTITGYLSYTSTPGTCTDERPFTYTQYTNFVYYDKFGTPHAFYPVNIVRPAVPCGPADLNPASASDGSGYTFNWPSTQPQPQVTTPRGMVITPPNGTAFGAGLIEDANGNEITVNSSGQFTDTTGNVALTIAGASPSPKTFTYTDTSGNSQTVTMSYKTYMVQTAFGCTGVTDYPATSTSLVNAIEFPDGSTYTFSYEPTPGVSGSVTGRLASIELPQGGVISYTYTGSNHGIECADGSAAGLTRTQTASAGSAASTWTYTRTASGTATSQTAVIDGLSNHKTYNFVQATNQPTGTTAEYYETSRSLLSGTGTPAVLARNTCYNGASNPCTTTALTLPIAQIDTYETLNGLETHGSTFQFNAYGAQTQAETYDFASGASRGSLLRNEVWTYGGSFANLPTQDEVFDGSNHEAGNTLYGYDGTTPTASSGVPQHVAVTCPCGNLTSETLYANASTTYALSAKYEDTGSILTSTTPSGTTTLGYDSTFVYNTSASLPTPSSGVAISSGESYDTSYTGLPLTVTDPNSQPTKAHSYDSMLRLTQDNYPDGGQTNWTYTPTLVTTTTLQALGVPASNEVQYDSYGRQSRTATANGQSANPYYQQDTCYDANGNLVFQSYTYQSTGLSAAKGCSVSGSTVTSTVNGDTYAYDVLGRLTKVTRANGEIRSYTYTGRATELTDANNNQRISQIDGLGRPTIVCEISSGAGLVNSGSPASCGTDISGTGFTTTYAYALATGTTTVTQGAQTRTFQTDWLGRTTSVTEPESGTTTYSYAYNSTGLVVTRTRPKANQTSTSVTTTTTTQYDTVGRPISITYSDGTPTKTYAYDAGAGSNWTDFSATNLKGRLSLASVSGAASAFSYDPVGRVNYLDSCLPSGPCGTVADNRLQHYTYDLAGDLLTSTDGSTVTSTYTVTPAFELKSLTSSLSNAENPAELVSSIGNGPNGPISYNLGNGLSAAYRYDTLGRFNGTWVCSGSASAYCSGGTQIYGNTVDGRVGIQIKGVSDTVLNAGVGFGYDQFNRLTSRTVNNGTAQNFTYTYDRWGNRWSQTVTSGSGPQPSYSFNTSTNQITSSGFAYDAAGNLTNDGSHTYTYDAEGNITAVDGGSTATYVYDALNHRIRTIANGATTEFVFNQNGQRASVWNGSTKTVLRDQYYWGSQPVAFAAAGAVHFQHQDYLGTERIRTTYNGSVEGSYISLPFGDGYTASGSDLDPYHYAQLDYDSETNTSHAQYREYSSTQGRWMRPDPYSGSYDPSNPQSLNRYSYALNSPLTYSDPSGLLVQIGNCLYAELASDDTILDQDGNVIGTGGGGTYGLQFLFCGSAGGGGGGGGGAGGGGGGGGSAPNNSLIHKLVCSLGAGPAGYSLITGKTVGIGIGGSAGAGVTIFGVSLSLGVQLVTDPQGNVGLAGTFGANLPGLVAGIGGIAGIQVLGSNAQTIYDLSGPSLDIGGSAGAGIGYGLDVSKGMTGAGPTGPVTLTGTVGPAVGGKGTALTPTTTGVVGTNCSSFLHIP